jgi:DNA-binding response OmpR family regulator
LGTGTPSRAFQSCLLVTSPGASTLPVVRALHSAGIAVLERLSDSATVSLATSGEFDLVAWVCDEADSHLALARVSHANIPAIALLSEATPARAAACLGAGADACLQLDADALLVVAQARAVLRRRGVYDGQPAEISGLLMVGDLTVDVDRCEVQRAGRFVALTASEFRIVEFMARNSGRVLRPHEILNAVSDDYEYLPREAQDVFKVYVRRIRRKLEPSEAEPRYLITVRGFGYRLEGGSMSPARQSAATYTA